MIIFDKIRRNWLRYFLPLFFVGLVIVGLEIFQPFINTAIDAIVVLDEDRGIPAGRVVELGEQIEI